MWSRHIESAFQVLHALRDKQQPFGHLEQDGCGSLGCSSVSPRHKAAEKTAQQRLCHCEDREVLSCWLRASIEPPWNLVKIRDS